MSKIQDLKGTHNLLVQLYLLLFVVSDVKDTRFERNSQLEKKQAIFQEVVSDVKDTRFERNSQPDYADKTRGTVVSDVKDTRFERNSQHFFL